MGRDLVTESRCPGRLWADPRVLKMAPAPGVHLRAGESLASVRPFLRSWSSSSPERAYGAPGDSRWPKTVVGITRAGRDTCVGQFVPVLPYPEIPLTSVESRLPVRSSELGHFVRGVPVTGDEAFLQPGPRAIDCPRATATAFASPYDPECTNPVVNQPDFRPASTARVGRGAGTRRVVSRSRCALGLLEPPDNLTITGVVPGIHHTMDSIPHEFRLACTARSEDGWIDRLCPKRRQRRLPTISHKHHRP